MEDSERQEQLARLKRLVDMGEKAYDDMYEAHSSSGATVCYADAKDFYCDAIGLARRLGLEEETKALEKRLEHIRAVFRSQFV